MNGKNATISVKQYWKICNYRISKIPYDIYIIELSISKHKEISDYIPSVTQNPIEAS